MAAEQNGNTQQQASVSVTNADERSRYEINVDGAIAGFTEYVDRRGQRIFFHTEIEDGYAGRGLGSTLISQALGDTSAADMRIVTVCPFVTKYVKDHHEFDDNIDKVTPATLAAVQARKSS